MCSTAVRLALTALLFIGSISTVFPGDAAETKPPNLVIIFADDTYK